MGHWLEIRPREVHRAPSLILQISLCHKHPLGRPQHQPVKNPQAESRFYERFKTQCCVYNVYNVYESKTPFGKRQCLSAYAR